MGRNLFSAFLSIFSARVLTSVVAILSLPVVVRILGPAGYGDYAFLMSAFNLLMIFVSSGVTEGVQKFVGEDRDDEWRDRVVGFYLKLGVALAMIGGVGVAGVAVFGPVEQWLGPEFRRYFGLLALLVLTVQFRSFTRRTLMGMGLERYSEPLQVASKVVWVVAALGLLSLGWGVAGLLAANVVSSGTTALVGGALILGRVSVSRVVSRLPPEFPRSELLSFNALNVVLALLMMSLYHVDVLMLRTLAGDSVTGYYKAALAVAEYLWFVPLSLQTLLLHSTSDLWADRRLARIESLAAKITRYALLLTVLLALGVAALADRFVPLYFGAEYAPAVAPLRLLLPGALAFAVVRPVFSISRANGDLRPLVAATGGAALLNAALNVALIPRYGMVGAAIATGVGYGSMLLFHVASARRLGYDPLADLRAGRVAATAGFGAVAIFGTAAVLERDPVALAVVPVVGFAAYLSAALLTGAVGRDEMGEIAAALPVPEQVRAFAGSLAGVFAGALAVLGVETDEGSGE
ncbi:oligosaccharide flippase family protein [Halorussus salinisoli]|uniref:oligosaccharide flippase family protein n=1 Tax=Halorussus salinisoli TaxID=2558242 RepID=UPI0010C21299|nr:polysaccharide biosynthesis C-terminal domain-containing protein [Halorussus salinisoli]